MKINHDWQAPVSDQYSYAHVTAKLFSVFFFFYIAACSFIVWQDFQIFLHCRTPRSEGYASFGSQEVAL